VAAAADDTDMFRGGPLHTGVYTGSAPPLDARVKWRFPTGGRIISSPAIMDGTVYFGSFDGDLYAVNETSGTLKWKFETQGPITSSPAVIDGTVLFGSYDGNFYAVDAASGREKWHFATGGERRFEAKHIHGIDPPAETMPDFWDFYLSSPVVDGGFVYFGSGDGNVYKLNVASGVKVWSFATGDVVHSSPALFNNRVYVGSFDKYFYAIDASTGELKWRYKTGEDPMIHNQEGITSSPAISDGIVYFGCRNATIYALDAGSGALKWSQKGNRGWVSVSPAVNDGKVYVATGSDMALKELDAKTGQVLYSRKIGAGTFASPAVVGNLVILATFDGKLRAIDPAKDAETILLPAPPLVPIALASNFYDDHVAGMMARLKEGAFLSSPVVHNGVVFVGHTDGSMIALGQ
ncbi:MAG: PQQ-binding-like beta-propeller repeat protein, partial [Terriglobales bacterium]